MTKTIKRLRAEGKRKSPKKSKRIRAEALETAEEVEAERGQELDEPKDSDMSSVSSNETQEVAQEGIALDREDVDADESDLLRRTKEKYRSDEGVKEATNALSNWVAKFKSNSAATSWTEDTALDKAIQYVALSADLHDRTAGFYEDSCQDPEDRAKGARWHHDLQAKRRAMELEGMKPIKVRLVTALKQLKSLFPEQAVYKQAR
jgi:hypothetical protein